MLTRLSLVWIFAWFTTAATVAEPLLWVEAEAAAKRQLVDNAGLKGIKADEPVGGQWISVFQREATSQLPAQARGLEAALSLNLQLRQEFQAEMLRLKWADRMDAWQQRAKALEVKLGRNEAKVSEIQEMEKEFEALRSLLVTFWFRNLGFHSLLVEHRPRLWSSHIYTYHEEFQGKGGKLVVFTPEVNGGSFRTVFDAGDGRIHRYDLSFDGREIVFAWQKSAAEPYQVYRINVDGTGLTQLTSGPSHNFDPCWLPDGDIAFISTRDQQWALCLWSRVGLLYRMDRGGGTVRKLSYGVVHDLAPSVLNDGRIVYTRWEYVDKGVQPIQSLWTINPDGTMLQGFYGNRVPGTFFEARAIPGTGAVLCTLTGHMAPISGAIGIIDPRRGDNAPESLRNVTPGVSPSDSGWQRGGVINGAGPYETPYPIDAQHFLVSRSGNQARDEGAIELRDYQGRKLLEVLSPVSGGCGYYSPQPLRARPAPPVRGCPPPDEADGWATLFLQDVYWGLEPEVRRGEVKQLCVVEEMPKSGRQCDFRPESFEGHQFTVVSRYGTYASKKVWGYVPVEEDGSACFKVPARTPLYFMALDNEGRAVQRMRTFTFLMPGQRQGCVGCHEPRSKAPATGSIMMAQHKPPRPLDLPEWGAKGFSYPELIQPIWDRHCVRCHQGKDEPKAIDLTGKKTQFFSTSYETLVPHLDTPNPYRYVNWISTASFRRHEANVAEIAPRHWGAVRSPLAELVRTGHPDAKGNLRVQIDDVSRRRIFTWIDLNVPFYGSYQKPAVH
ncbi:MAG: hypothetical protein ABSF26_25455 [Thermoguttaceae bacterium]|jgi:hypothetical protein